MVPIACSPACSLCCSPELPMPHPHPPPQNTICAYFGTFRCYCTDVIHDVPPPIVAAAAAAAFQQQLSAVKARNQNGHFCHPLDIYSNKDHQNYNLNCNVLTHCFLLYVICSKVHTVENWIIWACWWQLPLLVLLLLLLLLFFNSAWYKG